MKHHTLTCDICKNSFTVTWIKAKRLKNRKKYGGSNFYCSTACAYKGRGCRATPFVKCAQCGKERKKVNREIRKTKNNFCGRSCAGIYNNAHKTHGTRRSKLEVWLENQLPLLFPFLEFHFNRRDAIKAELDIFIPSLNLAFELNGIFHYEPIFGEEKLAQTQNNDNRKFQACLEKKIELCVIDSTGLKYFKPLNAQKYLDIIVKIINQKLPLKDSNLKSPPEK